MDNQKKAAFENYLNVYKELDEMNNKFINIGLNLLEASKSEPETPGYNFICAIDKMSEYILGLLGIKEGDESEVFYALVLDYMADIITKSEIMKKMEKYWK